MSTCRARFLDLGHDEAFCMFEAPLHAAQSNIAKQCGPHPLNPFGLWQSWQVEPWQNEPRGLIPPNKKTLQLGLFSERQIKQDVYGFCGANCEIEAVNGWQGLWSRFRFLR